MAELAREIRKHMSLLDEKLRLSNKHLEFITGDARVAMARYQGAWKAVATVAMLLPAPWIPGPVVRSGINWIFTENASEAFNFHRSFLPGIVLKAAYGDQVPEWANAVFENGLNAPATVVGTDGMVYRVDGTFPTDYKNAGKASFKYVKLDPGTERNVGGTTLKIPELAVSDASFTGSMAVQLANGDPEIDRMIIIDAVELQVLNAIKMLRGIDTTENESAAAALKGLCLKVIGDVLLKYYTVRWLSEQTVESFYPSALANVVRYMSYPVEHEGAIQYRYGMYHESLSNANQADWFNRARLRKANQRPAELPEAVWNRADSETFDSDYKRLLKNVKAGAAAEYATNLLHDNGNNGAENRKLAANLLCFKAYCYAYGIHVGGSLSTIVQGGTLADTNSSTSSWGTKNVFARYTYPAVRNSLKVLTSVITWRTASADTSARLLFPLAMYASMLEMRFGTTNTALLQYEAIDGNQQHRFNRQVAQANVQLQQAPPEQQGQQRAANAFFNLNAHTTQALSAAFAAEFAAMNATVQVHERTGWAPILQRVGGDDENPQFGPSGNYMPVFEIAEYQSARYDATLLGILDCMLSSAYFVYQTIGWDYTVTKLWGGDHFGDWGLFDDPTLIGYITLRKKFILNYDAVIRAHCSYLKEKLKDGWTTSGTSWWAPTPRTWKGVGLLSQGLAQPGTWLGKALDSMSAWLTKPTTQHNWDFNGFGLANALNAAPDEALDPDAANGFSNFVAQQLDFGTGAQSNQRQWAKSVRRLDGLIADPNILAVQATTSQRDVEAACEVLSAYLSNGGDQKKVLQLVLQLLPKLA